MERATALPDGAAENAREALPRVLSRWEVLALALNGVIGSGVYLLPAAAAALLGSASVWAVPLAGLTVALVQLCFVRQAAASIRRARRTSTRARPSARPQASRSAG